MKNKRRIITLLLVVAVVTACTVPALAATFPKYYFGVDGAIEMNMIDYGSRVHGGAVTGASSTTATVRVYNGSTVLNSAVGYGGSEAGADVAYGATAKRASVNISVVNPNGSTDSASMSCFLNENLSVNSVALPKQ